MPPSDSKPAPGQPDPHADEAKGTPNSDRHASETHAGRQEGVQPAEQKTDGTPEPTRPG